MVDDSLCSQSLSGGSLRSVTQYRWALVVQEVMPIRPWITYRKYGIRGAQDPRSPDVGVTIQLELKDK